MPGSGGSGGNSGSNLSVLIQSQMSPCGVGASQPLDPFFLSGSSPPFLGSRSMMSFEDANQVNGSASPFFGSFCVENGEDELDEYFRQPEKKRRLTLDQVQFLEKSFEVENKLEPERKLQLAKDIGLQPRQVAIWFQNRRARWKTKQLEKDYETLQSRYNDLKDDYDKLLEEKHKLKAEVNLLTNKLLVKDKENGDSECSDKHLEQLRNAAGDSASDNGVSKVSIVACKQEDLSSAKSDIFDADSPRYADGLVHSPLLEAGDSSYAFEPDQSDLSQDEEDNNLSKSLMPPYVFPKLEDDDYSEPPTSFEDHAFWSWSY